MVVGIVGSRKGADLGDVQSAVASLHRHDPQAVVVSGGAAGVDTTAEQAWLELGGRVISYRPAGSEPSFYVEKWYLSPGNSRIQRLDTPTFSDYTSACLYRDMLIAETCDRLLAFQCNQPYSPGTQITVGLARDRAKPVYIYTPKERFTP